MLNLLRGGDRPCTMTMEALFSHDMRHTSVNSVEQAEQTVAYNFGQRSIKRELLMLVAAILEKLEFEVRMKKFVSPLPRRERIWQLAFFASPSPSPNQPQQYNYPELRRDTDLLSRTTFFRANLTIL